MGQPGISRREFGGLVGAGLGLASCVVPPASSAVPLSPVRVAAVQMTAVLANVEANLTKAERLVHLAFERGARWVVLPEFFTSAMAFHGDMLNAVQELNGP